MLIFISATILMKTSTLFVCAALAFSAVAVAPAHAQVTGYTYNPYRNSSNFWDRQIAARQDMTSVILRSSGNAAMNDLIGKSGGKGAPSLHDRGRAIIKSGKATNTFPMRQFPLEKHLVIWQAAGISRAQAKAEWQVQSTLWRQEVAARRAPWGDFAALYAVAYVMAFEAYTGQKLNDAGYKAMLASTRPGFLKDAGFQGRSAQSKQELYEETMSLATNALRLRRAGDMAGAKKEAAAFIGKTWKGDPTEYFDSMKKYAVKAQATPVKKTPGKPINLAPKSVAQAGNKPAQSAKLSPDQAWREAVRVTSFVPTNGSIVPAQMGAAVADGRERKQAVELAQTALGAMKRDMTEATNPILPPNNVARAMAWAILSLRQLAQATPGRDLNDVPSLSPAQQDAVRRQIAFTLASDPKFRAMSDREKQAMQETFLILPHLMGYLYNTGYEQNNLEAQRLARQQARETFRQLFGADADKVRVTDDGILGF